MNENQIRVFILEALEAAYNAKFSDPIERENFLSGTTDYPLVDLGMDSLGTMEFCISLEINGVYVITPEELFTLNTLNELVKRIVNSHK
jgi:acyl carrier protein